MKNVEIVYTNTLSNSCSGNLMPNDHPKVYLEIDINLKKVSCPYCQKKFILK